MKNIPLVIIAVLACVIVLQERCRREADYEARARGDSLRTATKLLKDQTQQSKEALDSVVKDRTDSIEKYRQSIRRQGIEVEQARNKVDSLKKIIASDTSIHVPQAVVALLEAQDSTIKEQAKMIDLQAGQIRNLGILVTDLQAGIKDRDKQLEKAFDLNDTLQRDLDEANKKLSKSGFGTWEFLLGLGTALLIGVAS